MEQELFVDNTLSTDSGSGGSYTDPTKGQKVNKLEYDGQTGQVYKIWLINLLLEIPTLGIYRFWGKTRLRKYVAGSFSLGGDRFEYTGTGGELYKGFLKATPIYFGVLPLFIIASMIGGEEAVWPMIFLLPLIYIFPVAVYSALRYRMSRTQWRGVRGRLSGSALKYANLAISRFFLNVISLGFLKPHSDLIKHKYKMDNTYYGGIKGDFEGNTGGLYGAYFLSLGLFIVSVVVGGILFAIPIIIEAMGTISETESVSSFLVLLSGLCYLLGISFPFLALPLSRTIYTAALAREKYRGLKMGKVRFKSTITAWSLFRHRLANILIIIFTLGFGIPFVIQRNMRFFARHTFVIGDLDTDEIKQAAKQKGAIGEGMDEIFDLDTGLM